ncbi:MAG: transporter substrate-binding domain-containing protein [Alloprevotella sp.]|nr:transporter substrate-binding domain-containing protein [Alloprevotella sp.]
MRTRLFLLLSLLLFCACGSKDKEDKQTDKRTTLSEDTIFIGVEETLSALPFFYAEKYGEFQRQKLLCKVVVLPSQEDCSDAVLRGDIYASLLDEPTYNELNKKSEQLTAILNTPNNWGIVSPTLLRLQSLKDLKGRIIASKRNSNSENVAKELLALANLKDTDVAFPQIGNYATRLSMIENNQVDATVLPEPYLTQALCKGAKLLSPQKSGLKKNTVLALCTQRTSNTDRKNISALRLAYNAAIDSIAAKGKDCCIDILKDVYELNDTTIRRLVLPKFPKASL